jgi:hypothetical protein
LDLSILHSFGFSTDGESKTINSTAQIGTTNMMEMLYNAVCDILFAPSPIVQIQERAIMSTLGLALDFNIGNCNAVALYMSDT